MRLAGYSFQFSRSEAAGPEAMEGLALAVRERLYPFIIGAIRDHHAAEDVLQDTLVVLIEQVHMLRRPDRLWPWVYRVAWSKVQDHFRDRRRACQVAADTECEPDQCRTSAGDLLDTMLYREKVEHLAAALRRLNPRCRVVLYLRFYEQMPYSQIASLMHSTPVQVRTQFHRAKQRLRASLLSSCCA